MAVPCYGNNWSNGEFTSGDCDGEGYVFGEGSGFLHADQTIRPFFDSENCLFARGPGAVGSPVYLGNCEADAISPNKNGKYKWSYENGMIKNIKNFNLCMTMFGGIFHDNRVNLQVCDESRPDQKFSFSNGEIRSFNQSSESCMGFRTFDLGVKGKSQFVSHECFPSSFPRVSNGAGTGRGLEVTYLTDRSYASLNREEGSLQGSYDDFVFVEDFIFDTNTGLIENGFDNLFLSISYTSLKINCFHISLSKPQK